MEVEGPAQDATEAGAAAGDSCHPVGEADAEQEPRRKQLKMQALLADCPRPEPHTPTRGTSALVSSLDNIKLLLLLLHAFPA